MRAGYQSDLRGLLAAGHDVQVIPLYTPLRGEGDDTLPVSRIFYSGINVYLQQALAFFRITPAVLDRLFEGTALLRLVSKFAIETRAGELGPMTLSVLAGQRRLSAEGSWGNCSTTWRARCARTSSCSPIACSPASPPR